MNGRTSLGKNLPLPEREGERASQFGPVVDTRDGRDLRRMREYAEQLMIFVVGLLGAALILYVGKIFAPYIYPAAMAALISIPIAALNRRINRLLAQDLLNKLRACLRAKCLLVLGALLLSISSLAGLHLAILVLTGIIMALLALHRLGPKMFLLVTIVGTGSVSQLLLTNCFHEVILLSTDVVQRHSKFDAAFIDNIYASFETVDSVMKSNFGVGLYEAGTMAVRLLEEKSEEIDSNNKSGGERPPPKNGQEASAQLIAELDRLRGQLTAARVISRVRDLLSYEQLMRAAIYFARLLSTALRLLVGSAQRIIQGITFVYFLFYFIGQQESVLRYVAAPFVRVPEVQVFVRETEAAFEFVVRQYAEQVLGQIALSYVVFRACNVRLAMVLAMLAGLLEIFPLMPPTVVTLLAAAEIFFAGSMPVAILCILVHALINWLLMPRLILFKSPRSGYFAELSILVGFWTFGWVGLVLGPVLACIPAIIYRLFTGETVMGEGLTSSSPVDGEGKHKGKRRSDAKLKMNKG